MARYNVRYDWPKFLCKFHEGDANYFQFSNMVYLKKISFEVSSLNKENKKMIKLIVLY